MDQDEFNTQINVFIRDHLSPMMDEAAQAGTDKSVATVGLLKMASMVLRYENEHIAIEDFEDYISKFLTDWRSQM